MSKTLPASETPAPISSSSSPSSTSSPTFHLFPALPIELRAQIWQASLTSHIIRWIRTDDEATPNSNIFHSSHHTSPLLLTSHEARASLLLHAHYLDIAKSVWIDPSIDYLHLDLAWTSLNSHGLSKDPLSTLPRDLLPSVKRIMVNPNYTDDRLRPGIPLQNLTGLDTILVVADEKALGAQGKFLLASVYDLKKYYEGLQRKDVGIKIKIPHIAIGCLGWVGEEKGKLVHGSLDARQLVAVFETQTQMKEYLNVMREEELRFLKKRFEGSKKGFRLHWREGKRIEILEADADVSGGGVESLPGFEDVEKMVGELGEDELPRYEEVVAADHAGSEEENDDVQALNPV